MNQAGVSGVAPNPVSDNGSGETGTLDARLTQLAEAEQHIVKALNLAADFVHDLSKEKVPSNKNMEQILKNLRSSIDTVEKDISEQIEYLSNTAVGAPHQGNTFAAVELKHQADLRLDEAKRAFDQYANQNTHID